MCIVDLYMNDSCANARKMTKTSNFIKELGNGCRVILGLFGFFFSWDKGINHEKPKVSSWFIPYLMKKARKTQNYTAIIAIIPSKQANYGTFEI